MLFRSNIASVELTDYGSAGADDDGQKTASAKRGAPAKKDYDGDGKRESSSKEHAGVVHNAIQRKRGLTPDGQDTRRETRSESFDYLAEGDMIDAGRKNEGQRKNKKITGEGVDNSTSVVLMPKIDEALITEKAVSKSQ